MKSGKRSYICSNDRVRVAQGVCEVLLLGPRHSNHLVIDLSHRMDQIGLVHHMIGEFGGVSEV